MGGDYSHFDARYGFTEVTADPEMLRHIRWLSSVYEKPTWSKDSVHIDAKRLLTEQQTFQDSRDSLGLQLTDMLAARRGEVFHYDFAIDGRRYRGTTKESVLSRARMIEAKLMNEAKQRKLTVQRRTLTLAEFSKRFLDWVKSSRLEAESKHYYESGWRMLSEKPISGVRLAHITTDEAEALRFNHSPANANRALRTLRRMLGKAAEWGG